MALEEELAETKDKTAAAVDTGTRKHITAAGNLVDTTSQRIEEIRLQLKQMEDQLTKMAATGTTTPTPKTPSKPRKRQVMEKIMMCAI